VTCEECGREHRVEGQILVDGVMLNPSLIETIVEIGCKHDLLRAREVVEPPGEAALVEPDA
jgi:hypothetical protein